MNARAKNALLLSGLSMCLVTGGVGLAGAAGTGCSSTEKIAANGGAKLPEGVRSEVIEHEACDEGGRRVDNLDANGDGKTDIKKVFDAKTGKEACRTTDLNHDGRPDMYEYYDANGELRRREADYDDSGVVDTIEYYERGKLVRRELDTTGQHRIDTWDYFDLATGKRVRRERDSTNDGRIDQWWEFIGDAVRISIDKNSDGKPDPESTVTIGTIPDGGAPAPGAEAPDAGSAPGNASAPSAPVLAQPDASLPQNPSATGLDLDAGAMKEATQDAAAKGGAKK
jgi:hypothetical protein